MHKTLLSGGSVVDGTGRGPRRADVLVSGNRIQRVGGDHDDNDDDKDAEVIDCTTRLIFPGFIDTHCHLDGQVFDPDAQRALLRQGVTSVILGQDGVSFAPGDGRYAQTYFAAINGAHPSFAGGSVDDLLASYEGSTPVNVGYLIPQGTVRHNVMGMTDRTPTEQELNAMVEEVDRGMRAGALGLSTGLDYTPGRFASTAELVSLCAPVRRHGGLYVSHLRGYKEPGISEAASISVEAGVPVHISHYHGPTSDMTRWLDDGQESGADLTFDAYPYDRGCTNLSLLVLPPAMQALSIDECLTKLERAATVAFIDDWLLTRGAELGLGANWLDRVELTYVASPELSWAEGSSITAAASRIGIAPAEWICRVLRSARLEVGATVPFGNSGEAEAEELARDPRFMCASDGIYLGSQPHPRGWGSFARVLARYCRQSASISWGQAAWKLSGHAAQRFSIPRRGLIVPGAAADLAIVDPDTVSDRADYGSGRTPAVGIADVLVEGQMVLRGGELTGATSGVALRRQRTRG